MKRYLMIFAIAAGAALAAPQPASAGPDTVTICHATGSGKYVTLTIPSNAAFGQAGHFYENGTAKAGHEDDYLGPCVPSSTTTSTTTTTSSTTSTTSTTTTSSVPTTSSSTTTPPSDSSSTTSTAVTTTSISIDTCVELGSCPDKETTTTVVTSSTLAEGGLTGTSTGISIAALLALLGGSGLSLLARRP